MLPEAIFLVTGALILNANRKKSQSSVEIKPIGDIQNIIVAEAKRQGLDPAVALLFADLETGIKNTTGDDRWPYRVRNDGRTNWEATVRDESRYDTNPYKNNPDIWISYGPFQLLSPHTVYQFDRNADPRKLADVKLNTKLAVAKIIRLRELYKGDVSRMRHAYVCGSDTGCPGSKDMIIARLRDKAPKYGIAV